MSLHIEPFAVNDSNIEGLKIISAKMSTDDRGTVRELFRGSIYFEVLPKTVTGWKQINLTRTKKGAVRGLHGEAMSKLVTVAYGSVFGAYVDTRPDSKTFGAFDNRKNLFKKIASRYKQTFNKKFIEIAFNIFNTQKKHKRKINKIFWRKIP